MKFRNPRGDKIIEGRLPKPEENFSEDRYYTDSIENVFVRYDPYKDYLRILFPCVSEIEFKIKYDVMEEMAKKEPTLKELISACYNVIDISEKPQYGYMQVASDVDLYVHMDLSK